MLCSRIRQWPPAELGSLARLGSPGNNDEATTGETAYSLAANFRHVRSRVLRRTDHRPECETALLQHPTVTTALPALVSPAPAIDRGCRLGANRPHQPLASDPNQTIREGLPSHCRHSLHDGNPQQLPHSRIERCKADLFVCSGFQGHGFRIHLRPPFQGAFCDHGNLVLGYPSGKVEASFSCCVPSERLEPLRQAVREARD